uniref:C2 domain-containing protein n=1 Tax=Wuchereria bancrofti TaxID=6293 RepID=A0A1I8EGT2_WUCBA
MLVPCGSSSLPAKLFVRVISARGLPVMDKSNVTTDAFVEVYFDNEVYKTDVCSRTLSPVWDSNVFVFETDEQQLFDNPIQFRVMDHDTYSANDAIGRVFYDVNLLVSKIRCSKAANNSMDFTNWLPIYDSVYGIRGEILISISLKLLLSSDQQYVRILSTSIISTLSINDIIGLVSDIATVTDPEYEWIDRIRSPRASNEARQSIIRKSLRELAKNVAQKAHSLGSNAVLGYHEFVDIEGDATELITFRAFGTAVRLSQMDGKVTAGENIMHHVLSLKVLPNIYSYKCGVVVCARSTHVLTDDNDATVTRKKFCFMVLQRYFFYIRWWGDLKVELVRQALSLRYNLIIGYTEQISIRKKMALLSCTGTAISMILTGAENMPDCTMFHAAYFNGDASTNQKINVCSCCKLPDAVCPDIILNTCSLPASDYLHSTTRPLQICAKRELNSSETDDQLAYALSDSLPFLEHELYNKLMEEIQSGNTKYNAIFDLKSVFIIQECALFAVISGTDDIRSMPRVGLLDAARILRAPRLSDKAGLHLQPLHIREHANDSISGPPQSNYKKIVKCFRKKVVNRERLAKMISEREISLQLGTFNDMKSSTWSPITYSGIKISNSSKFNISAKTLKSSNIPQRYAGVLIREMTRTVKDIADLDTFLDGALRDLVNLATSYVETVGATSFSVFKVPSVNLSISRDQASVVLFITTDFDYPVNL